MNLKILATAVALSIVGFATSSRAQNASHNSPVQPNQVPNACIQNQAETLSVPKSDVSPNHWAFKAVMTMHYCGAFRQATPTALWQ
ncbi:MAG: S-layer protein [Microcystaceae cyanobacterium]